MAHEDDFRADHFVAGSTPRIDYTLKDAAGAVITTELDTHTATIYDVATGTAVPTWTDKDIKALEGNLVTVGVGVWDLPASATALIDATATGEEYEDHVIAMKGTYDVNKVLRHWMLVRIYRQLVGS